MSAVILFRPLYTHDMNSVPTLPWGPLYVAGPLVERGVDVHIVDEAADACWQERVGELLETVRPIAVGISSMTGAQIGYGLAFAQFVRERSGSSIVWGGIHPTLKPEQTARHPLVDYVVAGEGEEAFPELLRRLESGGEVLDIPGVFYECEGEVRGRGPTDFLDFKALPEPPLELIDMERYISARPDLGARRYSEICTSRGCVHRCAFCYIQAAHGCQWRPLEAEEVVRRVKRFVQRYDLDCVLFREDNFFVDRKRVEAIARGFLDEGLGIKWAASCRINYFAKYSPEFIELLERSGCVLLTFGVESGCDRVLKLIQKDITAAQVIDVARKLEKTSIRSTCHFMGGFPTETAAEFLETCRLIEDLRRISPRIAPRELSVLSPFPGLSILAECRRGGFEEPLDLEGWIALDWFKGSDRPWLSERQVRLIENAHFLVSRLQHRNGLLRTWANWRWGHLVRSSRGIRLPEKKAIEFVRGILR